MKGVYLLHFTPRFKHAGHYLGYADDIDRRVYEHEMGKSDARLTTAAVQAGCSLDVVRVWPEMDRAFERSLKGERGTKANGKRDKHKGSLKRFCPVCKGQLVFAARAAVRALINAYEVAAGAARNAALAAEEAGYLGDVPGQPNLDEDSRLSETATFVGATKIDSSTRYDDMDMVYRQAHNK